MSFLLLDSDEQKTPQDVLSLSNMRTKWSLRCQPFTKMKLLGYRFRSIKPGERRREKVRAINDGGVKKPSTYLLNYMLSSGSAKLRGVCRPPTA